MRRDVVQPQERRYPKRYGASIPEKQALASLVWWGRDCLHGHMLKRTVKFRFLGQW